MTQIRCGCPGRRGIRYDPLRQRNDSDTEAVEAAVDTR